MSRNGISTVFRSGVFWYERALRYARTASFYIRTDSAWHLAPRNVNVIIRCKKPPFPIPCGPENRMLRCVSYSYLYNSKFAALVYALRDLYVKNDQGCFSQVDSSHNRNIWSSRRNGLVMNIARNSDLLWLDLPVDQFFQ